MQRRAPRWAKLDVTVMNDVCKEHNREKKNVLTHSQFQFFFGCVSFQRKFKGKICQFVTACNGILLPSENIFSFLKLLLLFTLNLAFPPVSLSLVQFVPFRIYCQSLEILWHQHSTVMLSGIHHSRGRDINFSAE